MIVAKKVVIRGIKGIDLEELESKSHNLWVGISFSNKFFTPENIKSLVLFCLDKTKEKVLVLLPGRMHATNYYIDRISRAGALARAFEDEDKFRNIVADILSKIPAKLSSKVRIANYEDICTPKYIRQKEEFLREFAKKGKFYNEVLKITAEIIKIRKRTYNKERAEALALYVISELPFFVNGVHKIGEETLYTVVPYPGFDTIDELEMDIIEGNKYPELTKKLCIENRAGIIDVSLEGSSNIVY